MLRVGEGLEGYFNLGGLTLPQIFEDRLVAVGGVVAIELGHDLLVGQDDDIGEFAVVHGQRFQRIDGRDGVGGVNQLDEEIDVDHRIVPPWPIMRPTVRARDRVDSLLH